MELGGTSAAQEKKEEVAMTEKELFKEKARNFQVVYNQEEGLYYLNEDGRYLDGIPKVFKNPSEAERFIIGIMRVDHDEDTDEDGEKISYIAAHTITYE